MVGYRAGVVGAAGGGEPGAGWSTVSAGSPGDMGGGGCSSGPEATPDTPTPDTA